MRTVSGGLADEHRRGGEQVAPPSGDVQEQPVHQVAALRCAWPRSVGQHWRSGQLGAGRWSERRQGAGAAPHSGEVTATPDRLDLPARRRRHARLIANLTTLIGSCAEAASSVYQPIAAATPDQEDVAVNLLPLKMTALSAATLLDLAGDEDRARWPAVAAREQEEADRTYAARCAVAQAQELVEDAGPPGGVPLPTLEQAAVIDLASAGDEVAAQWRDDPEQAVALVYELAAGGEFSVDEVLDAAVEATVLTGLLALHVASTASDPSTAAERCLGAVPYIALAVTLASADLK